MKKIIMVMILLLSALAGGTEVKVNASITHDRATWLWDPWMIVNDEEGTLAFLESKRLNKVYLQIDRNISASIYQSFIEKSSAKGMEIYALDGAPEWAAPQGYISQDHLMAWLSGYQEEASPQQEFSGVHLDVEPYLYSGWNSKRAATVKSYQALLLRAKNSTENLNLPLEADMPFWFDEISYNNIYGKGLLAEWVIAGTDGVTIMAYRDSAALITDFVKKEIEWAGRYSKRLIVGVETGETSEGDTISFFEEGEIYMNEQLEIVKAYYENKAGFGGTAVHHVGSWMTIKP
ncbi:amidase [Rossellomorea vietnamensis]|uniref:Amidase n=1 Tax=Rossellomorea vietnamensis TaxID=218284 RepID=A0A5D4KC97_9BACI|nr:amidase [Rossellomorea vietnamensis]TYR74792.1 amidase [Rossellomorea vietnamensis]